MVDGEYKTLLFENDDDVWKIVDKLIEETKMVNIDMGKSFDISSSVFKQLPFFACKNIFISKESQEDISKHIYCTDYGVPPFPRTYGQQPSKWVRKSFIIKNAIAKRDNLLQKQHLDKGKNDK